MRFFCFVVLMLLSTVAKTDCLDPEDILTEKVEEKVYAHFPKNKSSYANGWVKSSIPLSDVKQAITIEDHQVNVCSKSPDGVEHESIDITLGAVTPPCTIQGLDFVEHDSVMFSLLPAYETKITEDICSGNNNNIKVLDENVCRDKYLGNYFTSSIGRGSSPVQGSTYNKISCQLVGKNRSSNLVNLNNSDTPVKNWRDHPLLVIDSETKDPKDSKMVNALKGYREADSSLSDEDLQKEFWSAICYDKKPSSSSDSTLKAKKSYINQVKEMLDVNMINKKCGNICYYSNGVSGGGVDQVTTNCLFERQSEKQSDNSYISYLPGTSIKENGKALSTYGEHFPKGLSLDYEYELSGKVPKVQVDIIRGNEGAYNLRVFRSCPYRSKRSLYYYIGKDGRCPDTLKPGDKGTKPIEMIRGDTYLTRKVFLTDPSWKGVLCFGLKDSNNGKDNHSGFFKFTVRVSKTEKHIFANIVNWVRKYVDNILYGEKGSSSNIGVVRKIYNKLVHEGDFIKVIRALLVLYIAIYGLLYMIGMIRSAQLELIVTLVKISLVLILISPQSWQFFDDNFFKLFTEGNIDLINIMSAGDKKDVDFQFIDKSLARFAEGQTWLQIFAVIFTGPTGFICAFIVIWGVWTLFLAILRAIIIFLVSIVVVALLLSVSPVFIAFVLFKRTRMVFDSWIKILIQTIMQPVMVFAAIVMLNEVMMGLTYALFNFGICSQCFLKVDIGEGIAKFCLMNTYMPATYQPDSTYSYLVKQMYDNSDLFYGVPMRIPSIISFVILCHATAKFVEQTPKMVSAIFGIGIDLSEPAGGVEDTLRSVIGQDQQALHARAETQHSKNLSPDRNKETDARTKARQEVGK